MAVPSLAQDPEPIPVSRSPVSRVAGFLSTYGLALIVLTLPLEFTGRYIGQPLARWVMAAVALAFVYEVATEGRAVTWPRRISAALLAVFLAVALITWVVTRAPGSFKEVGDAIVYPVFGILTMNLAVSQRDHARAWTAFLASGLVVAAVGLFLYLFHLTIWAPNPAVAHRLNITFADPNITARFLTLVAAAGVILFAARKAPTWLCAAAAAGCAVVLPMTFSRSGLVLFAVTVVLAAIVASDHRRALVLAACTLILFGASTGLNAETRQRTADAASTVGGLLGTTHGVSGSSAASGDSFEDNRKYLIAAGLKMFTDHPVIGVGFAGYQHAISTTYSRFIPSNVPNPDTQSHTTFVTIAAEEGAVGVALILAFFLLLAREAWFARRYLWALLPATLIVPIVIYSQIEGRLIEEPYFWLCLGLFYAATRAGGRAVENRSHTM